MNNLALEVKSDLTLEDFLTCLEELDEGQFLCLAASYQGHDPQTHADAWTQVVAQASQYHLEPIIAETRRVVTHWTLRGTNEPWPYGFARADTWWQLKSMACPALTDAAIALMLSQHLNDEVYDRLLNPWLTATGKEFSPQV